jgi:hypothetical protein
VITKPAAHHLHHFAVKTYCMARFVGYISQVNLHAKTAAVADTYVVHLLLSDPPAWRCTVKHHAWALIDLFSRLLVLLMSMRVCTGGVLQQHRGQHDKPLRKAHGCTAAQSRTS